MTGKRTRIFSAASICLLLVFSGCLTDPGKKAVETGLADTEWPDLSEKDDCIETILLLYNNSSRIDLSVEVDRRYANILYDDPAGDEGDYLWYMSEEDVGDHGSPVLTREQDIDGTRWLLMSSIGMELHITGAQWYPAEQICEGCYSSARLYTYSCSMNGGDAIRHMMAWEEEVVFVVGPHHDDPEKWAIYSIMDNFNSAD